MATNNLFNVPSWTSIQELFFRRLGITLNPDAVTYSYDGNAKTITVTANTTLSNGAQGPFAGSVTFDLDQLQVTTELPPLLVWSNNFPMTVQALADYLLTNYGYYLEDGEFSVSGDPDNTPLVRGGTLYNGLNALDNTFKLQATRQAIRWNQGSQLTFKVASSQSIVPANGFAISSASPPDGSVGAPYSYTYTVQNGTPPYTFSITQGMAPGSLNNLTGVLSASVLAATGDYSWIIQVTDAQGRTVTRLDQITVVQSALVMAPATLNPVVEVGVAQSLSLGVSGGMPPYDYSVYLGSLPEGVALVNGAIVGTFEGTLNVNNTSMSSVVGIQVEDQAGTSIQRLFTFTINDRSVATIQAALCAKVLHWFDANPALYGTGLVSGSVVYDGTGRADVQVTTTPGASSDTATLLIQTIGSGASHGFLLGSGVYLRNQTVAFNLPDNFCLMALVSPGSTLPAVANQALISRGGDANGGYELKLGADASSLALDLNLSGAVVEAAFPSQLPTGNGNWSFITAQRFTTVSELEINAGSQVTLDAMAGSLVANQTDALYLGIHPDLNANSVYTGGLGMIGLFTDKLWSDERKWLYNAGQYRGFTELGYWPACTLTGQGALSNTTIPLGQAFAYALVFSGGSGRYTNITVAAGTLPAGLNLSYDGVDTITLSGIPQTAGTYSFTIQGVSTDGHVASSNVTNVAVVNEIVVLSDLPMAGTAGSVDFPDSAGPAWTAIGNAAIATDVDASGDLYVYNGFVGGVQSAGYLSTPLTSLFDTTELSYTCECDVYPKESTIYVLSSDVNNQPMTFVMGTDAGVSTVGSVGGLYPYFGFTIAGTFYAVRSAQPITLNAWSTLKGVCNLLLNELQLFINGQFMGALSLPSGISPPGISAVSGNALWVGRGWDDTRYSHGYFRHLLIEQGLDYDRVSLASQVFTVGMQNEVYSASLPILGGNGHYSGLVINSGVLPPGLSLTLGTNSLNLAGTPTVAGSTSLNISFRSGDGQSFTTAISIGINEQVPALVLSGTFADGQATVGYSSALTISGGNGVYSSPVVQSGSLPDGLSLSIVGSTLVLSGTPTTGNQVRPFTVSVTSGDGQTVASSQNVSIAAFDWTASLFANGEQGVVYDFNDLSTVYKDAAGTQNVTTVGDPINAIRCKRTGVLAVIVTGYSMTLDLDNTYGVYRGKLGVTTTSNDAVLRAVGAAPSTFLGDSAASLIAVAEFGATESATPLYIGPTSVATGTNAIALANINLAGWTFELLQYNGSGFGTGAHAVNGVGVAVGTKDVLVDGVHPTALYFNGAPLTILTAPVTAIANVTALTVDIGRNMSANRSVYACVAVDRALTAEEVATFSPLALPST